MAYKLMLACALVAAVGAIELHHAPALVHHVAHVAHHVAAPVYHAVKHVEIEHDAPAHYDFSYSVHDSHTGDVKSASESRKGDAVHGSYSLIDADGYKRTVEYTADDHHGFNAVVHREPLGHHVAVPVAHKVIAAPLHHY